MGRDVALFLMRAAGMLIAGMLLFAVFGHAHAQTQLPTGGSYVAASGATAAINQ